MHSTLNPKHPDPLDVLVIAPDIILVGPGVSKPGRPMPWVMASGLVASFVFAIANPETLMAADLPAPDLAYVKAPPTASASDIHGYFDMTFVNDYSTPPRLAGHQHGTDRAGAGRPLVRSLQECERLDQQGLGLWRHLE
jgi:hypothetical protein